MREIKCRGKRVDNGKWVEGYYVKGECSYIITPELFCSACVSTESPNHMSTECYQVIPETVGQYTGLKDKKRTKEFPDGQPIYKGDIVRHLVTSTPKDMYDDEIVIYDAASFKYERCNGTVSFLEWPASACLEVIGNIYQDPELQRAKV